MDVCNPKFRQSALTYDGNIATTPTDATFFLFGRQSLSHRNFSEQKKCFVCMQKPVPLSWMLSSLMKGNLSQGIE